jgi:hypothetical protein
VAAIISEYGMARPVPNAREKWKKQEKRSFGHDTDNSMIALIYLIIQK